MYLDKDDSLHLSIRDYAPTTKELVKRVVKKGDVVVDVGAHVGYYSLLFAELVGEKGHVFSFQWPVFTRKDGTGHYDMKQMNDDLISTIRDHTDNHTK